MTCPPYVGPKKEDESTPELDDGAGIIITHNYPNPFNPTTEISFDLPAASHVKLDVFNSMGQKVTKLLDMYLQAGKHSVIWDGSNVASGVYLYRLEAGNLTATKKMILLK